MYPVLSMSGLSEKVYDTFTTHRGCLRQISTNSKRKKKHGRYIHYLYIKTRDRRQEALRRFTTISSTVYAFRTRNKLLCVAIAQPMKAAPGRQQNTKRRATGRSTVNGHIGVVSFRSGPQRRKQTAGHQLIPSSKGKHTTYYRRAGNGNSSSNLNQQTRLKYPFFCVINTCTGTPSAAA